MESKRVYTEFDVSDDYKYQIDLWYRAHNIHREKIELFYDFLTSLYDLINETFLGADVLYNENDILSHFNWCWKKTIENFIKEKIYFKVEGNHYEYWWTFFSQAYYENKLKCKTPPIIEYLFRLFDFKHIKTQAELDILTEVYKIMEQNLKK